MKEYANPDVLVTTEWVAERLDDPEVRIVESDEDVILYEVGHVPGAVKVDWHTELQDQLIRDYVNAEAFEQLVSQKGIGNDHTVVFYGDKSNWWACYAFWVFKLFGHEHCRVMDGGRQKWIDEGRALTREVPQYPPTTYKVKSTHEAAIRAFRSDVAKHLDAKKPMVDVRSPMEYTGELLHME
ncbi:MAG: sulfurtransferase, partial [Candidatus Tectimicrobiota bacterium]